MSQPLILSIAGRRTRSTALDSVDISVLTGLPVPSVSAWLCILRRKGFLDRVARNTRRDAHGRRRRTYAYFAADHERPASAPKRQPYSCAALVECWR